MVPCRSEWNPLTQKSHNFLGDIGSLGFTRTMGELERGKLSVFNQLNFFPVYYRYCCAFCLFFWQYQVSRRIFFCCKSACLGEPRCVIPELLLPV